MRAAGFKRNFNQLRIKWKNMKKTFVEGRRLEATGSLPYSACPFYDQLYGILKNDPSIRQISASGEDTPSNYDSVDTASTSKHCINFLWLIVSFLIIMYYDFLYFCSTRFS